MRVPRLLFPALAALGPPLAAWGGYGLGVGAAGSFFTASNLLAAGLTAAGASAGLAAALAGRRAGRLPDDSASQNQSGSFAADAAVLEALAPAAVRHPRGAACLKTLAELLFEVHHPADAQPGVAAAEGGVR